MTIQTVPFVRMADFDTPEVADDIPKALKERYKPVDGKSWAATKFKIRKHKELPMKTYGHPDPEDNQTEDFVRNLVADLDVHYFVLHPRKTNHGPNVPTPTEHSCSSSPC